MPLLVSRVFSFKTLRFVKLRELYLVEKTARRTGNKAFQNLIINIAFCFLNVKGTLLYII